MDTYGHLKIRTVMHVLTFHITWYIAFVIVVSSFLKFVSSSSVLYKYTTTSLIVHYTCIVFLNRMRHPFHWKTVHDKCYDWWAAILQVSRCHAYMFSGHHGDDVGNLSHVQSHYTGETHGCLPHRNMVRMWVLVYTGYNGTCVIWSVILQKCSNFPGQVVY